MVSLLQKCLLALLHAKSVFARVYFETCTPFFSYEIESEIIEPVQKQEEAGGNLYVIIHLSHYFWPNQ